MSMRRITFSVPWPWTSNETREVLAYAFILAVVSYAGFAALENFRPGFVSQYFDLDWIMWTAIILGGLSLIWPAVTQPDEVQDRARWKNWIWVFTLALASALVIGHVTAARGSLRLMTAAVSGLAMFGLGWLFVVHRDPQRHE